MQPMMPGSSLGCPLPSIPETLAPKDNTRSHESGLFN